MICSNFVSWNSVVVRENIVCWHHRSFVCYPINRTAVDINSS